MFVLVNKMRKNVPNRKEKTRQQDTRKDINNFESIKLSDNRIGYPLFCLSYTSFWYKHLTQLFYLIHKHSMGYFFLTEKKMEDQGL